MSDRPPGAMPTGTAGAEDDSRWFPAIVAASRRLNASPELEDVAAEILALTCENLACGAASLAVHDEARRLVRYIGALGRVDLGTDLSLPVGRGVAGWVVERGASVLIADGGGDARLREGVYARMGGVIANLAAAPLRARGRVAGVIEAVNRPGGFGAGDLARLEALTEPMGIALENARLLMRMRKEKRENEMTLRIVTLLNSARELGGLLGLIIDSLAQIIPFDSAGIYLIADDGERLEWLHLKGYTEEETEGARLKLGQGLVGWVAKTGSPVVVPDVTKDPRYVKARAATRSEIVAPLVSRGRVIGAFNCESDRVAVYTENDLERLAVFAGHATAAIETARLTEELVEKRRLEQALAIARGIQKTFLPQTPPDLPGFELWGLNVPSEEVGGDYYDFIEIAPGQVGLTVADVSGKGVPSALIMAAFRASLRAEIRNHYAIRTILAKVNRLMHESLSPGQFVTAVYGVLDVQNSRFTYSNAGHNPPLLRKRDGSYRLLETGGLLLGPFADAAYTEKQVSLVPGDLLVLYTDGVTEAFRGDAGEFGVERLKQVVEAGSGASAREICESVAEVVSAFRGEERIPDDLTVMVVRAL